MSPRLTLLEALLHWGEPQEAAEMQALARKGYAAPFFMVGGPPTEHDRNQSKYSSLRRKLEAALIEKLRAGTLQATGYDTRAPIDAPPVSIPRDRWRVLKLDFKDSSASTAGAVITGILVSEATASVGTEAAAAVNPKRRLQIRRDQRRAFINGIERVLPDQLFKVLQLLAEHAQQGDAFVSNSAIEERIWGNLTARVRRPTRDVIRELRDALAKNDPEPDDIRHLIQSRKNTGYRLRLRPEEISIEPAD